MKRTDPLWLVALMAAAAWIWLRDRTWLESAGEVLPVLAALPLFVWLGAPWKWKDADPVPGPDRSPRWVLALGVGFALAGVALDVAVLLAAAWTAFLWGWLSTRLEPRCRARARRLLLLPLLAFPWLALDGAALGWWFRLSGAWTAEQLFGLAGLSVTRAGTHLLVQGLPISVDASCAGLKVLQALLIAGTAVAFLQIGDRPGYWWSLPALGALAWLANTLRVLVLSAAALTVSPEFAQGWFHAWGGWFVLMLMFVLSAAAFSLWRRTTVQPA
jgi:exosortase